ncbi:TolC family protein [Pedobacter sp. SAFR-022]|uniref:TolC family protein n=1 Tax=Pedobacter sp. SAFR-022 TaxID=3436861 RepID=UPI003F817699
MKALVIRISLLVLIPFAAALGQQSPGSIDKKKSADLTLQEAEKLFLQNNAELIAQGYQVEQSRANIITAKLFENPELSYENLFYNQESGKFLQTSMAYGQFSGSLTQLIRLAGKRNKDIKIAKTELQLENLQYYDLIRTLRFELRSTFYEAFYTQSSILVYDQLIGALDQLLRASEKQLESGNIANKDVIRIKSSLYGLKMEYTALQNGLEALKSRLKLLCGVDPAMEIGLSGQGIAPHDFKPDSMPFQVLLDSAKVSRADLQLAKTGLTYAQDMLALQHAKAVPDVAVSLSYDLKGNYPEKYTGIGISMPIPLFNRNQGEIKKAKIAVETSNAAISRKEAEAASELYTNYQSAIKIERVYKAMDVDFKANFDQLMEGVISNFRQRNISLLEFLDFYDAYKESTIQRDKLQFELMNAKEALNYQTGTNIFK